ncbi:Cof-type HAD-IIB family hydrolase [Micrococcus sp.]|uniref:HAD family hydrolase n=1 Tax=Micrococcus sp. TaxID=1271 RepID=UPI002A90C353|nr:Cof-type HAD-IIB family hydrolase [Micrococcus sp.]MDY6055985.1 Cof-type HAD-IIB family hydrolase [Micrococcus sp.]
MPALPESARRPRLIATDLDGTIVGYAHTRTGRVSPRTLAALRTAHRAGVHVVVVTGRPLRWLAPLRAQLGDVGPMICSNGAVVVDPASGDVLASRPVPRPVVHDVAARVRALDPTATFGAEALEGFFWEEGFSQEDLGQGTPGSLEQALPSGARVVKLMARSQALCPDEFLAAVRAEVGDAVTTTHSAPGMSLVEISAPGVHKAATLAELAASRGVGPADVVAFGDMPNDAEMLTWAGLGLAVADAHPSLREVADAVVGACDDDGVAAAVETLLQLPVR